MTTLAVVEHFDVINKLPSCLYTCFESLPKHSLGFKRSKEAFSNSVDAQQSPFRLILDRMPWVVNNS